jgi:hypothetical protein
VRTRKFMANPLMSRKQFVRGRAGRCCAARTAKMHLEALPDALTVLPLPQVVDVLHPGRANVSKARSGGSTRRERCVQTALGLIVSGSARLTPASPSPFHSLRLS